MHSKLLSDVLFAVKKEPTLDIISIVVQVEKVTCKCQFTPILQTVLLDNATNTICYVCQLYGYVNMLDCNNHRVQTLDKGHCRYHCYSSG